MLLQTNQDQLIEQYIVPDERFSTPDRAWIAGSTDHVTTVIRALRSIDGNVEETARQRDLPVDAVQAAIAYYERHQSLFDARITLLEAREQREGQLHTDTTIPFATLPSSPPKRSPLPDDNLVNRYVETAPGRATADVARLGDSGYTVKAMIVRLQQAGWDVDRVAREAEAPIAEVRAAIAYYHRHRAVIDARILLDRARTHTSDES